MRALFALLVTCSAVAPATADPLKSLGWLAGDWVSEREGSYAEEQWTDARAGAMVGMFRLVKGDRTVFVELMTILRNGDGLVLRLRHFDPQLTPFETEKDGPLVYRSREVTPDRVVFVLPTDKPAADTPPTNRADRLELSQPAPGRFRVRLVKKDGLVDFDFVRRPPPGS